MEAANARVTEAVNKLIDDVDRSCLRKIQTEMFKCSARCCENNDLSLHQVQECVNRCNAPAQRADQYVQSEMQSFQGRLQRCAMDCKDKGTDSLGTDTSEKARIAAQGLVEKCVIKCVDTHIGLLPGLFKRMKEAIKQQDNSK